MSKNKKELRNEYKQTHTPMGIYQIRNLANDKVFVGSALNLPGILNSNKIQLKAGTHHNKKLQADWNEFGSESFVFEALDELAASAGSDVDYRAELAFLEDLWLEKLAPYGERGYNEKKKGREEKLRQIMQNRLKNQ
jgi:hypothetical protein